MFLFFLHYFNGMFSFCVYRVILQKKKYGGPRVLGSIFFFKKKGIGVNLFCENNIITTGENLIVYAVDVVYDFTFVFCFSIDYFSLQIFLLTFILHIVVYNHTLLNVK